MKTIKVFFLLWLSVILLCSCEKQLLVEKSDNLILNSDVFKTTESANSAVLGLYSRLTSSNLSILNGGLSIYPALSSDELMSSSVNSNYDMFYNNTILSNSGIINTNFWSSAYNSIYHANSILEGLESSSLDKKLIKVLIAEAKVIRAVNYYYLLNLFGAVPLVRTTDFEENLKLKRAKVEEVYDYIQSDLLEAYRLLADQNLDGKNTRINKYAVAAFLSKLYLYLEKWNEAEKFASVLIESNKYSLESDLRKTFELNSKETILQFSRDNNNTSEGAVFIPASPNNIPPLVMREELTNLFETGDLRFQRWVGTHTIGGRIYRFPYKYKIRTSSPINEHVVVLRLAEQFLIRAEANLNLGKKEDVLSDLERILARAYDRKILLDRSLNSQSILELIRKERQRELFCEWGHRWFDLKRWGMADEILNRKPNWKNFAKLYPIPFNELLINNNLTQNEGYEQ